MDFNDLPKEAAFGGRDLARVLNVLSDHLGEIGGPLTSEALQSALDETRKAIDERPSRISIETALELRDNPKVGNILRPATPEGFRAMAAFDLLSACLKHWDAELNAKD